MLSNSKVWAVLPATDIKRARKFYEETLGLKTVAEDPSPGILLQASQGTMIYLYEREPWQCDHTVAAFHVDNFDAEMKELRSKGVIFEEYDNPQKGIKTANGIATVNGMREAWFRDSEGNKLSIGEWSIARMKTAMSQHVGASTGR